MAEHAYDYLEVERREAVGRIVQDRPGRHNAMPLGMAAELADAVETLAADDAVRAIELTATGDAFNTGADLSAFDGDAGDEAALERIAGELHRAVLGLVGASKPAVVGVNGTVAGGGLGLAMAGDVVLVAATARIEFAYPRVGLCGDGGSTWLLPRLVGHRRAREIALLDDPIDAGEAVDLGLATRVVAEDDLDDELAAAGDELAAGPTAAYAETKRLLLEGQTATLADHLDAEAAAIAGLTDTEDYARGLEAFLSKGSATFVGR